MSTETIALLVALVLMVAVVGARIGATQLLRRMQEAIRQVEMERQQQLNELKAAHDQEEVTEKNKQSLLKKKSKLQKKQLGLENELKAFEAKKDRKNDRRIVVKAEEES